MTLSEYILKPARIAVGILMLYSAIMKFVNHGSLSVYIREMVVLDEYIRVWFISGVIVLELYLGIKIMFFRKRESALLTASFTLLVQASVVFYGLFIGVVTYCGCLGADVPGEPSSLLTVFRNIMFVVLCMIAIVQRRE